ncbi:MAG: ATP-binding protein [Candidatus Eisenbacteria bacterium]|nr:ATP-binding protein [Candidatus Eisenbacteria bacterium]
MYINRDIELVVKRAARQFPALIVTGPRQSGKTTLLKHLFSRTHKYVSMDNPDIRLLATDEPSLFFENYPPPLIIDEVQYSPEIFSHIKILVDSKRAKRGQFLLTGSQSFPLMARVSESLAGRIAVFTLLSLSLKEQFKHPRRLGISNLKKRALTGGFPEVLTRRNIDAQLWFSSYLQTYLERDIRQLRLIGDLTDFQRFLQLLAAFNGQVMNLSSLSRDLGVAVNTIRSWISILEASGQVISIKPFYLNKGKRIIKSPKIYFLDTGLLCHLLGIVSTEQVFRGVGAGQLFEAMVLGEIVRDFHNRGVVPRIFWWRTSYGEEVDFVLEHKGRIIPIEVKLSSKVSLNIAKSLLSFCKLFQEKIDNAFIVNLSNEKLLLDRRIVSIPFAEFIEHDIL